MEKKKKRIIIVEWNSFFKKLYPSVECVSSFKYSIKYVHENTRKPLTISLDFIISERVEAIDMVMYVYEENAICIPNNLLTFGI